MTRTGGYTPLVRARHGTLSGYTRGCSCELCRAAKREYNRARYHAEPDVAQRQRERVRRYHNARRAS